MTIKITPPLLGVAVAAGTFFAFGGEARADILAPSTRPLFFTSGIGPDIFMATCASGSCGGGYGGLGGYSTGFGTGFGRFGGYGTGVIWHNEVGGHFGRKPDGPAMAGYLNLGAVAGFVRFGLGAKFLWDIPIIKSFYLEPSTSLGYGLLSRPSHHIDWRLNFAGKLVLGNRGIVYFQPVGLNVLGGDPTYLNWVMLFGGGVSF